MAYDVVNYIQANETRTVGREYEGVGEVVPPSYDEKLAIARAIIAKKRLLRKYYPEVPVSEKAITDLYSLQCLLRKYRNKGEPPCPT